MSDMKPVYIRWKDSRGVSDHWQRVSRLDGKPLEYCIVESMGFIIRQNKDAIHIAPHMIFDSEDTQFCGDMQIPKSAIIEILDIE